MLLKYCNALHLLHYWTSLAINTYKYVSTLTAGKNAVFAAAGTSFAYEFA